MNNNEKYMKWGEGKWDEATRYECTKRKCKWQGRHSEKKQRVKNKYITQFICPKCGNNEFYGLREKEGGEQ